MIKPLSITRAGGQVKKKRKDGGSAIRRPANGTHFDIWPRRSAALYGTNNGPSSNTFSGSAVEGHEPMARCSFNVAGSKIIVCTVIRPMFTSFNFWATSAISSWSSLRLWTSLR